MAEKKKKTAIDVVIDSFLKRVQKGGYHALAEPSQVWCFYQLGI